MGVAFGVVLTACSGGGGDGGPTAAESWAGRVCGEIASWQAGIQTGAQALGSEIDGLDDDLRAARAATVEFLEELVESTDAMIGRVRAARQPEVDDGARIAGRLRQRLGQIKTALAESVERARVIPVDSPAAFERGAQAFGTASREAVERVTGVTEVLAESPDLAAAFRAAPGCQALGEPEGG